MIEEISNSGISSRSASYMVGRYKNNHVWVIGYHSNGISLCSYFFWTLNLMCYVLHNHYLYIELNTSSQIQLVHALSFVLSLASETAVVVQQNLHHTFTQCISITQIYNYCTYIQLHPHTWSTRKATWEISTVCLYCCQIQTVLLPSSKLLSVDYKALGFLNINMMNSFKYALQ